jgi:hypothetical protein
MNPLFLPYTAGFTQLALRLMFARWALAHIFGVLKPNYKQKQCDNIVSPVQKLRDEFVSKIVHLLLYINSHEYNAICPFSINTKI